MNPQPHVQWWQRLLWFAGLWLAGVATVAVVGYALRLWL